MYIASAPTDMSALSMTVMAVVMAFALTAWLGLVFLADRQPRGSAPRAKGRAAVWTEERVSEASERRGKAAGEKRPAASGASRA